MNYFKERINEERINELREEHLRSKNKFQEEIQDARKALFANDTLYARKLGIKTYGKVRVDFDDSYFEYGFIHSYEISEIDSEVILTVVKPNGRGQISKKLSYKNYFIGIKFNQITLLPDDFDMRPNKLPKP